MCLACQEAPLFGAHSPPVLNLSPGLNPVTMDAHQRMSPTYDVINDGESGRHGFPRCGGRPAAEAAGYHLSWVAGWPRSPLQRFPEHLSTHAAGFLIATGFQLCRSGLSEPGLPQPHVTPLPLPPLSVKALWFWPAGGGAVGRDGPGWLCARPPPFASVTARRRLPCSRRRRGRWCGAACRAGFASTPASRTRLQCTVI